MVMQDLVDIVLRWLGVPELAPAEVVAEESARAAADASA